MTSKTTSPPPAYFLSLSLENVRSFGAKQTISFARPDGRPAQWTIILGDNGVGKTTVLKALAAMQPTKDLGLGGAYFVTHYLTRPPSLFLTRHRAEKMPALLCEAEVVTKSPKPSAGSRIQKIEFHLVLTKEAAISKEDYFGVSMTPGSRSVPSLSGLVCYGYGAGRTVGNSTLSGTPETIDTCVSLFDDRADLLNPEEWFLQMEYSALKGEKQDGEILTQVVDILLQVLPDVTDIRISSKGHQQYLELETPYGWVRLRDMSLGYQTLVVWLTDFASKLFIRYPDSANPLEEPAIVLIDEIDLHLHPSWQRKLIGFLSGIFKNTQFIATAHSPLVVQAAGDADANVVLLRREGDQTVVVTDVEDVRGWRVDQILTSSFYNLETARSLETEKKLERQATLLNKEKLSAKERRELDALTLELEGQPMGSTAAEQEEEEMLRELTRRVGKRPKA